MPPRLSSPGRTRVLLTALILLGALSCAAGVAWAERLEGPRASPALVSLGGAAASHPIPDGFLGLSFEYRSAATMAGLGTGGLDPVLEQLIRNLSPHQRPVLRIGGDSTDHSYVPAAGVRPSPGLTYAITPGWIATMSGLAHALDARMMLGINLEADQTKLAAAEATAFTRGFGRSVLSELEIGNEPSLYGSFGWYESAHGKGVPGRPRDYDFSDYLAEIKRFARALPANIPLAGPALGSPPWMAGLRQLLVGVPRLHTVTYHSYPMLRCGTTPVSPHYPSLANLLSVRASRALAAGDAPFARTAAQHGDTFRVDELNTVACGGKTGVSNTFASALWSLDTLFALAGENVSGVNVETWPGAAYRLFETAHDTSGWSASVAPEYYGLLMFTQAAPPGSHLLRLALSGESTGSLRAWATRDPDGVTRVLVISTGGTHAVTVRAPATGTQAGSLERLSAPSRSATGGVTLGERSFGTRTTTGTLPPLQSTTVLGDGGRYTVTVTGAGAALLTIP